MTAGTDLLVHAKKRCEQISSAKNYGDRRAHDRFLRMTRNGVWDPSLKKRIFCHRLVPKRSWFLFQTQKVFQHKYQKKIGMQYKNRWLSSISKFYFFNRENKVTPSKIFFLKSSSKKPSWLLFWQTVAMVFNLTLATVYPTNNLFTSF